jgi:hypothetical protein
MAIRETMYAVTPDKPCPVCRGDHKCSVGDGGLILCGRMSVSVEGFRHLGPSEKDSQFHLYRISKDMSQPTPTPNKPDWSGEAIRHAGQLTPQARAVLAATLQLPEACFAALPLGVQIHSEAGYTFAFPEVDATGQVIGISLRFPDGKKSMRKGSQRGLVLPKNFRDHPGPVLLVEGASDTLALVAAGLCAVGRPSAKGGVHHLAKFLAEEPRPIIVVGENDAKPNGLWPGRDGAVHTAKSLSKASGRKIAWTLPPEGAKDVRAWLVARVATGVSWVEAGQELLAACERGIQTPADLSAPSTTLVDSRASQHPPQILIRVDEHNVNDDAVLALASEPDLYQRGGMLTRVVVEPDVPERILKRTNTVRIEPIPAASLRERLTRVATWFRERKTTEGSEYLPAHPPEWCVGAILARGDWPGIRRLEAVVEYPVLLPSGELLDSPGFDAGSGLLYQPSRQPRLIVPSKPTQSDAAQAVAILFDVVADFPFVGPAHRSAWLAALLTPLARFAFAGPTPLFLVEANTRGAGKGLLLHVICQILLDRSFAVSTYTSDVEELRKRITAIASDGDLLVLLDNIDGPFGNSALDAAMTTTIWKDRILGQSRQIVTPLWTCWYGTGNNVSLAGDMIRRVCPMRLETPEERPEIRSDFRHPKLLDWVAEHRDELLSAALTILRGFIVAGQPDQKLSAWGSFEGWSNVVRQAIVWAGAPDPGHTRLTLNEDGDGESDAIGTLLAHWCRLDPDGKGLSASQVIGQVYGANPLAHTEELRDALDQLLTKPSGRTLGYKLRQYKRRMLNGRYLDHASNFASPHLGTVATPLKTPRRLA